MELLFFLLFLSTVKAQGCLQANGNDGNIPDLENYGDWPNENKIQPGNEAIVASYRFDCCGNITEWGADVENDGGGDERRYSIRFQVWRPSSVVQADGCYSMVGENYFSAVTLTSRLIRETPSVEEQISFQPGDVVGFLLTTNHNNPQDRGVVLDTTYSSEIVWYGSTDGVHTRPDCPFPVGSETNRFLRSSTNAAPVISVSTSTGQCPPLITTSTIPDQPTRISSITRTSFPVFSLIPTPTPSLIGDGQLPRTVQPDQTQPSMATPPTTNGVVDQTTSDSPPSVEQPNNNIGLIIGVVVVLILIMAIIALAIIAAGCFLRTRVSKKRLSAPGSPTAVTNPNYDSNVVLKKSVHYKPNSQSVTMNLGDSTVTYDSVDTAYTGMAHDYTYPTPSPTASDAKYTYITQKDSTKASNGHAVKGMLDANMYHAVGPDVGCNVYDEMQYADPDEGGKRFGFDKRRSPKHQYQTLDVGPSFGEPEIVPVLYEDPTVSKYRKEDTGFFDSIGIYVPTEEQRVGLGNHYELSDNVPSTYNKLNFFIEDQVYWAPATTTSGLYEQLAAKKYREIPRNQIKTLEQLGSGQFGEVYKGMWTVSGATLELAIKTLKPTAPEEDKVKFLQESAIMGQFTHPNVIKLYGVVTVGDPVMICLELMTNGDLRSYLRNIDTKSTQRRNELQLLFLRFAKEIAAGMDYLARKSFVHRDLAARNVLLGDSLTCKIGDFGMARDLMDDTYYRSKGGKIPVKWTAPEALLYKKYSTDSDVWSYGMVLFEIWSVGRKPFSLHSNSQVLKLVQTGHCQPPPPGCPRSIYHLMVNCWNPEHQERPKFAEVFGYLQKPASQLIYWSELDSSSTHQTEILGEDLEYGLKLYVDLQEKYKQIYESV